MKRNLPMALASIGLGACLWQPAFAAEDTCLAFAELGLSLERNATDGDNEVVITAKAPSDGLRQLRVSAPGGRPVASALGNRRGTGLREFRFESPEAADAAALLASFPQGTYQFSGHTVNGRCIEGTARLSHRFAPATELLTPAEDRNVSVWQVVLAWTPVPEAQRYLVELNNESSATPWTFEVAPPITSVPIPAHFLQRGSKYLFAVGVKTANGNVTYVERSFLTAP
jgi:hypothetical protein